MFQKNASPIGKMFCMAGKVTFAMVIEACSTPIATSSLQRRENDKQEIV